MQKVKDVFSDYLNKDENIYSADFLKANLYKKSNRLEICVESSKKISIKELSNFEEYITNRFKVGSARIEIQYTNIDIEPTIEEDWQDLVTYMSKKEPMTRAILRNSTVQIVDSAICVDLKIKGADPEEKLHYLHPFMFLIVVRAKLPDYMPGGADAVDRG